MKIGKIISVEYDRFKVRLYSDAKSSTISIKGNVYYYGNIGSYIKTTNSIGEVILCEVVAILDYNTPTTQYSKFNLDSSRELLSKPIGVLGGKGTFSLGIGIFPSLYSDVEIVTIEDLDSVLSEKNFCEQGIHSSLLLGYSKSMINYAINLNINKLFNIHTAVLGNSGSGKSNTIAHLLQEIYRKEDNYAIGAKTILFDVNGEYQNAFSGNDSHLSHNIETLFYKPNITEDNGELSPFILPHYLMNLDEWLAFLMASERAQKPFWSNVLQETYKFYSIFSESVDNNMDARYLNYFKWKMLSILNLVNTMIDSDTSKITAARGIIIRCKELVLQTISIRGKELANDKVSSDLLAFLNKAEECCTINFGNNEGKLQDFLSKENANIDSDQALEINDKKLKSGEYYDYHFLKIAVDIVLMEEEARGNTRIREFASTLLSRLDFFLNNPECDFMRTDKRFVDVKDYLKAIFAIDDQNKGKQLILIDTSELEADTLELTTSVVSRMLFNYKKNQNGELRKKTPIHLILDEAHRYIKRDEQYILRHNIFERIAREGRKYAIYIIISSQRPSELSSTVLSQCGNYIIHRIQNDVDMKYIYSVLPYYSEDYPMKIRQLVPGEALVFGNFVPMPLLVKVIEANPHPNSENCIINKEWFTLNPQ